MQLIYSDWAQESVKNTYQQYDPALLAGLAGQEGTGRLDLKVTPAVCGAQLF